MTFVPYLSTIVTFIFTIAVFNRYRQRGGKHLLLWSIGLAFYGLGTLSEVILSLTLSVFVIRIWYLTGAMLTGDLFNLFVFYRSTLCIRSILFLLRTM